MKDRTIKKINSVVKWLNLLQFFVLSFLIFLAYKEYRKAVSLADQERKEPQPVVLLVVEDKVFQDFLNGKKVKVYNLSPLEVYLPSGSVLLKSGTFKLIDNELVRIENDQKQEEYIKGVK